MQTNTSSLSVESIKQRFSFTHKQYGIKHTWQQLSGISTSSRESQQMEKIYNDDGDLIAEEIVNGSQVLSHDGSCMKELDNTMCSAIIIVVEPS